MGLTHCPLCVGLAVLSVARAVAHGLLLWQWRRPAPRTRLRLQGA